MQQLGSISIRFFSPAPPSSWLRRKIDLGRMEKERKGKFFFLFKPKATDDDRNQCRASTYTVLLNLSTITHVCRSAMRIQSWSSIIHTKSGLPFVRTWSQLSMFSSVRTALSNICTYSHWLLHILFSPHSTFANQSLYIFEIIVLYIYHPQNAHQKNSIT